MQCAAERGNQSVCGLNSGYVMANTQAPKPRPPSTSAETSWLMVGKTHHGQAPRECAKNKENTAGKLETRKHIILYQLNAPGSLTLAQITLP